VLLRAKGVQYVGEAIVCIRGAVFHAVMDWRILARCAGHAAS